MLGQVSASLAGLSRTVDDYDSMARRELIKVKQEKAQMCVRHLQSRMFWLADGFLLQARAEVP
jgi:Golgi SNAP receptor complex protein 2